jgi:hypothetical protein
MGMEVLPTEETVGNAIKELNGKADIFIVLAHCGYQDAKKLAGNVRGIHIVLSSHPPTASADFERVGETILMHCRGGGKYVGKLVLNVDNEGKITSAAGTQEFLDAKMEKDSTMQKLIDDTKAALQEYYRTLSPAPVNPNATGAGNLANEARPYVGQQRCLGCHSAICDSWKKTKHAQAFDDLATRDPNARMDPDCLSCHTTGYGSRGGYTSDTETPFLRGVQCESCHGPGQGHLRAPNEKGYGSSVNEATCRKCHDDANSPKFDYAEYREQILHPKK